MRHRDQQIALPHGRQCLQHRRGQRRKPPQPRGISAKCADRAGLPAGSPPPPGGSAHPRPRPAWPGSAAPSRPPPATAAIRSPNRPAGMIRDAGQGCGTRCRSQRGHRGGRRRIGRAGHRLDQRGQCLGRDRAGGKMREALGIQRHPLGQPCRQLRLPPRPQGTGRLSRLGQGAVAGAVPSGSSSIARRRARNARWSRLDGSSTQSTCLAQQDVPQPARRNRQQRTQQSHLVQFGQRGHCREPARPAAALATDQQRLRLVARVMAEQQVQAAIRPGRRAQRPRSARSARVRPWPGRGTDPVRHQQARRNSAAPAGAAS